MNPGRHEHGVPSSRRFRPLLKLASGGMGTVYLGQQVGAAGFQRLVAIKRTLPHLLEDPDVIRMFTDEARLASLVRHPNIVSTADVEEVDGELLIIMEYVEGASLSELNQGPVAVPVPIALRIVLDVCEGLAGLHGAVDADGRHLGLVHRDVSPQNILIGVDGLSRITDFGIARVGTGNATTTLVRGKPGYMAPEYVQTGRSSSSGDLFALGVVVWETLARRRLYKGHDAFDSLSKILTTTVLAPSALNAEVPVSLDGVVLRALADAESRFTSAREIAEAIEATTREVATGRPAAIATHREVGEFVARACRSKLDARREALRQLTPPAALLPGRSRSEEVTVGPRRVTGASASLAPAERRTVSGAGGRHTARTIAVASLLAVCASTVALARARSVDAPNGGPVAVPTGAATHTTTQLTAPAAPDSTGLAAASAPTADAARRADLVSPRPAPLAMATATARTPAPGAPSTEPASLRASAAASPPSPSASAAHATVAPERGSLVERPPEVAPENPY